jgi:hypothetical protein
LKLTDVELDRLILDLDKRMLIENVQDEVKNRIRDVAQLDANSPHHQPWINSTADLLKIKLINTIDPDIMERMKVAEAYDENNKAKLLLLASPSNKSKIAKEMAINCLKDMKEDK